MRNPPNVILIVFDTMRLDALDTNRIETYFPNLSKLKSDSVIFNKAISPASWTIPSHASLFTGKYPSRHSVTESLNSAVPDYDYLMYNYEGTTLAEYFKEHGYETISISQNTFIAPDTGLSRGFGHLFKSNYTIDVYQSAINRDLNIIYDNWGADPLNMAKNSIKKKEFMKAIGTYYKLKKNTYKLKSENFSIKGGMEAAGILEKILIDNPFFVFFNFMEMHDPHDKKSLGLGWQDTIFGNISKIYESTRNGYYSAVEEVEKIIGKIIRILKDKSVL